jgi:hypothetical protein
VPLVRARSAAVLTPRTPPSQTVHVPCAATATAPAAHIPSPPARLPRELHAPSTGPEDAGQSEHSADALQPGALPSGSEKSSAAVGRPAITHRSNCVANLMVGDAVAWKPWSGYPRTTDHEPFCFCVLVRLQYFLRGGKGTQGRRGVPHVPSAAAPYVPSTLGSRAINVAPVIATRRLPCHLVSDLFPRRLSYFFPVRVQYRTVRNEKLEGAREGAGLGPGRGCCGARRARAGSRASTTSSLHSDGNGRALTALSILVQEARLG